jgi:hypothetical protein
MQLDLLNLGDFERFVAFQRPLTSATSSAGG